MFVDSHCHLSQLKLNKNKTLADVIADANNLNVQGFLSVATNIDDALTIQKQPEWLNNVWITAGVHPLHPIEDDSWRAQLKQLAQHKKCIAIGETGLDYYYDKNEDTQLWQRQALRFHIDLANELKKPLVIHTRNAQEDTFNILKSNVKHNKPGVIHCFTEDLELARNFLELGFVLSFSGIITFKNAQNLRDVIKHIPLDKILIETDSPYLAPEPFRQNNNLPQYVVEVARCIAEIKNESIENVAKQTTQNFEALFDVCIEQGINT